MKSLLFAFILTIGISSTAQKQVSLENLNDFKNQAGNWRIVGDIAMNRNVDIHQKPISTETSKKRKKRKSKSTEPLKPLTFLEGTGILLNINDQTKRDHIVTNWEHGDIELEFEVMLPKGSNSGVYLQGRYEVQLLDSWGVKNPKFSDIGGIYENHSKNPVTKLIGVPPASNAGKAPGLWQKFKVHFQAPRFDGKGKKTQNAKFISVDLNGVRIHTNVEVAMPTGGPISSEEVAMGPIMIQGDHGPVAFRNIKYKHLSESRIEMKELTYSVFKGEFTSIHAFTNVKPSKSGNANKIDVGLTEEEDNYAVVFTGTIVIPKEDNYLISLGYTGGVELIFHGDTIIQDLSESAKNKRRRSLRLQAGTYHFKLSNFKKAPWRNPALGLSIKGSSTNKKDFHEFGSYQESSSTVSPIYVNATSQPRLLRGFVTYENEGPKLSHTIGVGTPNNLNYIYDLNSANIIGVWRGNFADLTPMWFERGNATFIPRGAVQWTFLNQPLAELESIDSAFPENADFKDFTPKGYTIEKETGLPIFKHIYKGVEVQNFISSDYSSNYLIHQVQFSQSGLIDWYQKLASGKIRQMKDGSYAVDDQKYYINVLSNQKPIIRDIEEQQELILPVDGSEIIYEIIW